MENTSNCTVNVIRESGENMCFHSTEDKMRTLKKGIMALFLVFIFLASLIGNILVFLVFWKKPSLLTISNRFILNLTICNLFNIFVLMPFMFVTIVTEIWVFGFVWCKAIGFFMNTLFAASTLALVVITIDRYCAVTKPLHYATKITQKRAVVMTISVWITAVTLSLLPFFGWNKYVYQADKASCTALWVTPATWDKFYTVFVVSVSFALPLIIVLWGYIMIFIAARNNCKRTRRNSVIKTDNFSQIPLEDDGRCVSDLTNPRMIPKLLRRRSSTLSSLGKRSECKTAFTSCLVVFTFILCWLPYFIVIILESALNNPENIPPEVETVSILLAMSSCAINPLVYVLRNKSTRQDVKFLLKLQKREEFNESRRESNTTILHDGDIIQGSTQSDIIL